MIKDIQGITINGRNFKSDTNLDFWKEHCNGKPLLFVTHKKLTEEEKKEVKGLEKYPIQINSNEYSIPHIVNISLKNINSETMLHALEQDEIFISTKTACSNGDYSEAVYSLTKNMERAKRSLRISISHLTTKEELDFFVDKLSYYIKTL